MTATNDLKLVTPKSDAYGEWKVASEPIVKNKELDDWVPASKKTRIDEEQKEDAYGDFTQILIISLCLF